MYRNKGDFLGPGQAGKIKNSNIGMVDQEEQEIQIQGLGSNGQHTNG
jgi:hypothetical protein